MNNERWQAQVRRFLKSGYGVEDIAVLMACNVADVKAEVDILRDQGFWKGEHEGS